jgi:phosphomevalonate kinase
MTKNISGNKTTCSKMEQRQSIMTMRVASRLKKNTQLFFHVKMKHIEIPLSFHKRKKKKKKSFNEKIELKNVISKE